MGRILKAAFVPGGAYGTGALLTRDARTGHWVGPVLYATGEVSWCSQAGGEAFEVVLLAMTEHGVTAFLGSSARP